MTRALSTPRTRRARFAPRAGVTPRIALAGAALGLLCLVCTAPDAARADARDHDRALMQVLAAYDSLPSTEQLDIRFPRLVDDLVRVAEDESLLSGVRVRAVALLGTRPASALARATVRRFAESAPDPLLRRASIHTLARAWGASLDATERSLVLRAADDTDVGVRSVAVRALAFVPHDDAARALDRLSRGRDPGLARLAARTKRARLARPAPPPSPSPAAR